MLIIPLGASDPSQANQDRLMLGKQVPLFRHIQWSNLISQNVTTMVRTLLHNSNLDIKSYCLHVHNYISGYDSDLEDALKG